MRFRNQGVIFYGNGSRRSAAVRKSDINMTPMIDVLLVLLIIFMVITPVDAARAGGAGAAAATTGSESQPPPDQDRTVVIVIDKDKKMNINQEDTDMEQSGRPPDGDLQDARRARGLRQGRPDLEFQTVARPSISPRRADR